MSHIFIKKRKKNKIPKKNYLDHHILSEYLAHYLNIKKIQDYCPNGLQVKGKETIENIISGVTANQELIETAISLKADTILVHHGLFWYKKKLLITDQLHSRIKLLIDHNINLFAYHLPLDVHPIVGNNYQLSRIMKWKNATMFQDIENIPNGVIWKGDYKICSTLQQKNTSQFITLQELVKQIKNRLHRTPLVFGDQKKKIKKIAWCTGKGQDYIEMIAKLGIDVYISGEVSESTFHSSKELNIAYICAGHHATERYGIQALGEHLEKIFQINHRFIDIYNPI